MLVFICSHEKNEKACSCLAVARSANSSAEINAVASLITSPYDPDPVCNQDTTSAIFGGCEPDLQSTPATSAQIGLAPLFGAGGVRQAAARLVNYVCSCLPKTALAARWSAATGLVNSWVGIFVEKKTPAASWIAAAGLVKVMVGDFHRKTAPAA